MDIRDATWSNSQLEQLTGDDEIVLVITRADHETLRVPVWVVTVDGAVYVRSYKGATSMWFRRVQADADQSINLGGADIPVHFENIDRLDRVHETIDAEYDRKYSSFDYVSSMSEPAAVEATVRLLPR